MKRRYVVSVSTVIISIAIILIGGFAMSRITNLLHLPNVTAYIVVGILIGPYVLDIVPEQIIDGTEFLPDIALAFIAFSTGEFFKLSVLKKNGIKVVIITIFESLLATLLVFIVSYFVLKLNLSFSLVLGALAAATAPASTVMTIRQTGAKGDFVDTLLQVVALDDIVGLVAYSVAISIAIADIAGGSIDISNITGPIVMNLIAVIGGALVGFVMSFLLMKYTTDNRLIIAIAFIVAFCGLCAYYEISPLLGCMCMATVYINVSDDDKLFKQLSYWTPPIILMFFVRSGMNFNLDMILNQSGSIGAAPLLLVGIVYFIVRIIGKYAGAYIGCRLTGKGRNVRDYLGLALIPQAGVAIGLAALGARTLGGETGEALQTIILASSVLYELIGPTCGKLALYLSGSYSDRIENVTEVAIMDENGNALSEVDILKARIQKIRENIPEHPVNEDENEFSKAAEEYYMNMNTYRRNKKRSRR